MKVRFSFHILFCFVVGMLVWQPVKAQFLVDMIDTTSTVEKGLWAIYRENDHLQISGYFQPQFQVAQSKGAKNYSGGDFSDFSDNRFMIRRARIRFDYEHFSKDGLPQAQVVFQVNGSERGVVIRDFWARVYENKWQLFSFTTGMFARPFGYEVNMSSSDRESPERGRMSQILMRSERDLGAMVSLEPRKKNSPLRWLKVDAGIFNGQGLTAKEEYDSYKDIIGRISVKPIKITPSISVTGGASIFQGGMLQNTKDIYRMEDKQFIVDSSQQNIGTRVPRRYRGVDAQVTFDNPWGKTQLRSEYWWGTQTASAFESNTPGVVLAEPSYIRQFNGAFFYLVQDVVNEKHQVVLRYDFYDPNRLVDGTQIGKLNSNTHEGDVRFNTFSAGYLHYFNEHMKLMLWYDFIKNEHTSLNGYTTDRKDNLFTCRIQFEF